MFTLLSLAGIKLEEFSGKIEWRKEFRFIEISSNYGIVLVKQNFILFIRLISSVNFIMASFNTLILIETKAMS